MKIILIMLSVLPVLTLAGDQWTQWSGDQRNHHNMTPTRPLISKENVANLKPVWISKVETSVVDTPTVEGGKIYFTDIAKIGVSGLFSGGHLYAAEAASGKILWREDVKNYTKVGVRNFSRNSPAISGDLLVLGDSLNNLKFIVRELTSLRTIPGTSVMAVNRHTGKLVWKTKVEDHFASRITMSPIIFDGKVLVGVSSIESEIPAVRGQLYKCCNFKGSFVALDLATGKILWKTPMISGDAIANSGAPVWGNSPPIDVKRNRVYVGSGNNYHVPKALQDCYMKGMLKDQTKEDEILKDCTSRFDSDENRFDSMVALDLTTGKIVWSLKTNIYDAWNVGCGSKFTSIPRRNERICPKPEGVDGDFAQAPMLISTTEGDILVAGKKDGAILAVRAEDGKLLWKKQIGPGGKLGGHQWGSATDGKTIFFQTTNLEHHEITLEAGVEKGKVIRGGFWGALDALTGELKWQTADPATKYPLLGEGLNHVIYGRNLGRGYFAAPMGPLTYYNGLIFAGSLSGLMVAMDANDGKILWSHQAKGSVVTAPSVVNDQLFWGSGYHMGFQDDKLYSFGL